jgi:Putative 2OG-Fe(II) oxygenase
MQTSVMTLWPTNILVEHHTDRAFDYALAKALLDREEHLRRHPSHDRFDSRGWNFNLFREFAGDPAFARLESMFRAAVDSYRNRFLDPARYRDRKVLMRAWWNGYELGQNIPGHHHSGVHLTASYYPQAGEPKTNDPEEGALIFLDPRGAATTFDAVGPKFSIRPQAGMLVMFPGYLVHETGPYNGETMRIAISADILLAGDLSKYSAPP